MKPSTSDFDHLESNFYSTGLQITSLQRKELDDLAKLQTATSVSHQNNNTNFTKDEL